MAASTHSHPLDLIERLVGRITEDIAGPPPMSLRVAVEDYTDPERLAREREVLFQQYPVIVGHESQLIDAGDALVYDWLGLPLITLRDKRGNIATFINVCRHRGMRLVQDEGKTCLRALVCPYHQWTYGLDGGLRNIPLSESFEGLDPANLGLVPVPTEVRNGLIWVLADKNGNMDLDRHLAGLDRDLDTFALSDYRYFTHSHRTIDCNWKLIQDAFLDGYHVVRLHKNTVGPFFPDSLSESDSLGKHLRSAVARNEIHDAVGLPRETLDLRQHVTFSYTVFPNSVLIFHPDYTSVINLYPLNPDQTIFIHTMLTPGKPEGEQAQAHYRRSFDLIDRGVFEAEDIFVSEGTQRGLRSGANTHLLFGAFEEPAVNFHRRVHDALA